MHLLYFNLKCCIIQFSMLTFDFRAIFCHYLDLKDTHARMLESGSGWDEPDSPTSHPGDDYFSQMEDKFKCDETRLQEETFPVLELLLDAFVYRPGTDQSESVGLCWLIFKFIIWWLLCFLCLGFYWKRKIWLLFVIPTFDCRAPRRRRHPADLPRTNHALLCLLQLPEVCFLNAMEMFLYN